MQEKMIVTFISVEQCGFYAYGHPTVQFGDMNDLIAELRTWSNGLDLVHTALYSASGTGSNLPVMLAAVVEKDGTALVALWNEVPANQAGKMSSVNASAKVGAVTEVANPLAPGTIPGYATFFWFIPGSKVIAALRFDGRLLGQKSMQTYLETFLAVASSHAVKVPVSTSTPGVTSDVWAYRNGPQDVPNSRLHPRFRLTLYRKSAEIDLIRQRVGDIRRIHRRMELNLLDTSEKTTWQKFAGLISSTKRDSIGKKSRVLATMSTQITAAELESIINEWDGGDGGSQWDDYGFQFSGDSHIHWLSGSRASGQVSIDVKRQGPAGQIVVSALLDEVVKMKSTLLGMM